MIVGQPKTLATKIILNKTLLELIKLINQITSSIYHASGPEGCTEKLFHHLKCFMYYYINLKLNSKNTITILLR